MKDPTAPRRSISASLGAVNGGSSKAPPSQGNSLGEEFMDRIRAEAADLEGLQELELRAGISAEALWAFLEPLCQVCWREAAAAGQAGSMGKELLQMRREAEQLREQLDDCNASAMREISNMRVRLQKQRPEDPHIDMVNIRFHEPLKYLDERSRRLVLDIIRVKELEMAGLPFEVDEPVDGSDYGAESDDGDFFPNARYPSKSSITAVQLREMLGVTQRMSWDALGAARAAGRAKAPPLPEAGTPPREAADRPSAEAAAAAAAAAAPSGRRRAGVRSSPAKRAAPAERPAPEVQDSVAEGAARAEAAGPCAADATAGAQVPRSGVPLQPRAALKEGSLRADGEECSGASRMSSGTLAAAAASCFPGAAPEAPGSGWPSGGEACAVAEVGRGAGSPGKEASAVASVGRAEQEERRRTRSKESSGPKKPPSRHRRGAPEPAEPAVAAAAAQVATQTKCSGKFLEDLEADNRKLRLALEELRTKFNEFMGTCDSRGLGERVSMVAEEVGMAAAFKTQSVFDRLHQDALKRPARLEEMLQRYFGKPSKLWQAEDASRKGKPVSVVEGCFAEYPLRLWTKTPKEDDLTATSVSTSPEPAPPGKRLRAEPGASTHPGAACPKPLATAANTAAAAAPVGEPPSPGDAMRVASFLQHRRRGQSAGSTEAHGPNGSSLAPTAALAAGTSQRAFVQIPAASSPAGGGTADGGTFKRRPRPVLSLPALR